MDALPRPLRNGSPTPAPAPGPATTAIPPQSTLSERQREVLVVVSDYRMVGPSRISDLLGISLATAHRDLELLERRGLVASAAGKRTITTDGERYLDIYVFGKLSAEDPAMG